VFLSLGLLLLYCDAYISPVGAANWRTHCNTVDCAHFFTFGTAIGPAFECAVDCAHFYTFRPAFECAVDEHDTRRRL
jgi:hypothetical protein